MKTLKLQPRKYLLNPVQRDACPRRGETPKQLGMRYQSYKIALGQNVERRRARMVRRERGDMARLDMDATHSLQIIEFCQKTAAEHFDRSLWRLVQV